MKLTRLAGHTAQKLTSKQFTLTTGLLFKEQPTRYFSMNTLKFNEKKPEAEKEEKEETKEDKMEDKAVNALEQKIQEQEQKIKELQNKYLLSLSDQENTRQIAKKDVDSARKFALQNFALSLLEVPDTLSLALRSIAPEKLEEDGMKTFAQGIKMTENILLKVLKQYNIEKMENPVGKEFDPKFYEAILKVKNENLPNNAVNNVFKDGYLYHDRVLRAAQVSVVENDE